MPPIEQYIPQESSASFPLSHETDLDKRRKEFEKQMELMNKQAALSFFAPKIRSIVKVMGADNVVREGVVTKIKIKDGKPAFEYQYKPNSAVLVVKTAFTSQII